MKLYKEFESEELFSEELLKTILTFRAINHKLRHTICKFIKVNGRCTVVDVYIALKKEQAEISMHLAILRRAGILTTMREGKHIYYQLNQSRIDLINQVCILLKQTDQ